MTLKARSFEVYLWRGIAPMQRKIQRWLKKHPDVEVVSTESGVFNDRIGFILIYRDPTDSVPDHDKDEPIDDESEEEVIHEAPQAKSDPLAVGNLEEDQPESETPAESIPGGISTGALFGNYDPFKKK